MTELFLDLSQWTEGFAQSDWAVALLFIVAVSESIFFPVPPDVLLIAIGISQPASSIWLAGVVTAGSVMGAAVGHVLGRRLGRPLLHRFVSDGKLVRAELLFERYGAWAILVAAFTPIPYKVFTILAGVLNLQMRPFLVASLIGRGARFFIIGVLIFIYGESVRSFIEDNFWWVTSVSATGLVAVVVGAYTVNRVRKAKRALG